MRNTWVYSNGGPAMRLNIVVNKEKQEKRETLARAKKIRLYEGMYVGMYVEPLYPDLKAWCVGIWCVGVWCVGVGLCRCGAV